MRPHPILLAAAALVTFASNSLSDEPKPGGDQFVQFDLYAVPEAEAARLWNDPAFFTNGSEARKWAESLADAAGRNDSTARCSACRSASATRTRGMTAIHSPCPSLAVAGGAVGGDDRKNLSGGV
ncbi:MAG: hypothetical protein R3F11_30145 [Verrucomicrobiales bacterium]